MRIDKSIIMLLDGLVDTIRETDLGDQKAIAEIGATLESARINLPEDRQDLANTLDDALTGLQSLFVGEVTDPEVTREAVAQAVAKAETALSSGKNPDDTLEEDEDDDLTASAEPCLEDAAALLLCAEVDDGEDLERIQHILKKVIESGTVCDTSIAEAETALELVGQVVENRADDPQAALDMASEAVDRASNPPKDSSVLDTCLENVEVSSDTEADKDEETVFDDGGAADSEAAEDSAEEVQSSQQDDEQDEDLAACILPEDTDFELLGEYVIECLDHISNAEASLLELETNPEATEAVHTVFRAFHTIKGSSGFLGLTDIQALAHLAETLLDRVRNGEIKLSGGYADLALQSCDVLRTLIEGLEGVAPGSVLDRPENFLELLSQLKDPEAEGISAEADESAAELRIGDILVAQGSAKREEVEAAVVDQGDTPIGETLLKFGGAKASDIGKALRAQKQIRKKDKADATVRVSTARLDSLINMVGELVIVHSMIDQDPDVIDGQRPRLTKNVTHAGKVIRELQDLTMGLRMVPLKSTFQKMARLVRDLGRKSGKEIRLVTEGEDTEIDRNMVEELNDPLVHMMRNAVDHGIEPAEERKKAGKSKTGTVSLRAYHSAGSVVIELSDDGKGLDRDRIFRKAVDRNIIDSGADLNDSEVFNLIFQPGFSTASKITEISGRGVGMDVVKRGIEGLRGKIETSSQLGVGSTFALRLPLTMAITDAMLIRVGSERFLVPIVSILQSFRPEPGSVSVVLGKGEVVQFRDNLIPIVRLHRMFDVQDGEDDPYKGLLISIEAEGKCFGLMVDELLGQQQVVIKSLGEGVGQIEGVSGGAILGDGRVGLILDPGGLLRLSTTVACDPAGISDLTAAEKVSDMEGTAEAEQTTEDNVDSDGMPVVEESVSQVEMALQGD